MMRKLMKISYLIGLIFLYRTYIRWILAESCGFCMTGTIIFLLLGMIIQSNEDAKVKTKAK